MQPYEGVIMDDSGNLYGIAWIGGAYGDVTLSHLRRQLTVTAPSSTLPQIIGLVTLAIPSAAHFKDCKALTGLYLYGTNVSEAGLAHLRDCKSLASINLIGTPVGDASLVHFQDCKALRDLRLAGTQVSDAGLPQFKYAPLTALWIHRTGITDLALCKACRWKTSAQPRRRSPAAWIFSAT